MVAAPPEEGATPSLVTVSGSTVAVKISVMKLREPNMLVTMRHDQTLQNAITRSGLSNVVNDGKPPSRGAVIKANPLANNDVINDLEYDAMEQYQSENAKLFDLTYDSIDFSSEWEILDAEHVRTNFIKGAVRDGNGLLQWKNRMPSGGAERGLVGPVAASRSFVAGTLSMYRGNKGYDETVGSRGLSVMPYVEQYVHELSNAAQVCDQATMGDLGTQQVINSMISNTKQNMLRTGCSERYTQCMESMESAIADNSDPFSVVSYLYDFEDDVMFTRNVITAIINGVEMVIDPNEPENWHTPKNEREYLRSPQRAQWRTAREKKMDQYMDLKVFKLVNRAGIDPKRIMGSLWANKIKFDEKGKFCSLNPRWCVKGFGMTTDGRNSRYL